MTSLRERLKEARKERNLTQYQAASAIGLGSDTIRKIEQGGPVSLDTRAKVEQWIVTNYSVRGDPQ